MASETRFPLLHVIPYFCWCAAIVVFLSAMVSAAHVLNMNRFAVAEFGGRPGTIFLLEILAPAASATFSGLILLSAGAIVRLLLAIERNTRSNANGSCAKTPPPSSSD